MSAVAVRALVSLVVLGSPASGCKSTPSVPESPRPWDFASPLGAPVAASACDATADCPVVPRVACLPYDDAGTARYCNADDCHVDSDCADAGVCICGSPASATTVATPNVCLAPGNCRVDSDCSPVHYCSPSSTGCGTTFSYYCHTPSDDCGNDTDCRQDQFCQYAPGAAKWTCTNVVACNG